MAAEYVISLNNIAQLRLQPGNTANVVVVLGNTSFNDGGSSFYMWDSASTAADDGSAVIKVTAITTGRWIKQYTPIVGGGTGAGNMYATVAAMKAATVPSDGTIVMTGGYYTIGDGGYDFNGTSYRAANKFVRVIELQSFGNSRFNDNYISGDFSTPAPIPLYIENSHTSQFSDNWYDYSDGPALQMRYCYNLEFRGGNLQGTNRNSPTTNQYGGEGYGENECAIFIGNSDRIRIDNMVMKEIPANVGNQCTVRTWGCSNVMISNYSVGRLNPTNTSQALYEFKLVAENGSTNVRAYPLGSFGTNGLAVIDSVTGVTKIIQVANGVVSIVNA